MSSRPIELIGNFEENFYALGQRDKVSALEVYQGTLNFLIGNKHLQSILSKGFEFTDNYLKLFGKKHIPELIPYAEGLQMAPERVLFHWLLPEVVSSFNKWGSGLSNLVPGCTSVLAWDRSVESPVHLRVLDYSPLAQNTLNSRMQEFKLTNSTKIFSANYSGMPLPSLTAMNEFGLTMAIHYKHSSEFNFKGDSIFSISSALINQCQTIHDALKLIKNRTSITSWGINLSDKNGEAITIDISGNQVNFEKFNLRESDPLVFSNRPISSSSETLQPYNFLSYCEQKEETIHKAISKIDLSKTDLDTQLLKKLLPIKTNKNLLPHIVNSTSAQCITFNYGLKRVQEISKDIPLGDITSITQYSQVLDNTKVVLPKTKARKSNNFQVGIKHLTQYQQELDKKNISLAYHHIQMSMKYLESHNEYAIAKFYFLATQYLYEKDNRDLASLLEEFENFKFKLPNSLEDHKQLFILRLHQILNLPVPKTYKKFNSPNIKSQWDKEKSLTSIALKSIRPFIFLRSDIYDVIYCY